MERVIFYTLNEGPGPILDLMGPLAFKVVSVALRLGVFEALSAGPMTGTELAGRLKADPGGISILLETLDALGYVGKKGARYANTAMTARWMLENSPGSVAGLFASFEGMFARWDYLEEAIRRGEPAFDGSKWMAERPERWNDYHKGMRGIARISSEEIVSKVKLPATARRLLDMGGSHGLYAVSFCRRRPGLEATVLDQGQARAVAEETIAAEGMSGRVSFLEGDFMTGDLGGKYDAVLAFNVVRIFRPPQATDLFRRTAAALNPGGVIVVLDQLDAGMSTPFTKANALLIKLELFNSTNGKLYKADEISSLLVTGGFAGPRVINLRRLPGACLVVATKAA
jgi:hypothetical protein